MTDAELEELECRVGHISWKLGEPKLRATQRDAHDMVCLLNSAISTIRSLREENAARDRVVEAARATKADLLARANMAEADHVELGVGAWSELVDALAALEGKS